jgi:hypothetical protein
LSEVLPNAPWGEESPPTTAVMSYLADLYVKQGKKSEAEAMYKRCLPILERLLGPKHPLVLQDLANYAALLRSMSRIEEAERLAERVKAAQADQARPR